MTRATGLAIVLAALVPGRVHAQASGGMLEPTRIELSALADALPRQGATELRTRAGIRFGLVPASWFRAHFDGLAEALVADRGGRTTAVVWRARDAWTEFSGRRADLRVGYGRLVWGRLDEIQPTDVINPIDTARFLFEGRADARLPVSFLRGRFFAGDRLTVEGVLVPVFRKGTFDALNETSSPFNVSSHPSVPLGVVITSPGVSDIEPQRRWSNVSGGGRVLGTVGRVDVAGSIFRGFDPIGPVSFQVVSPVGTAGLAGRLIEMHPRFTMIGGDVETVTGPWVWRGEVAAFVDRTFAAVSRLGLVAGRSFDAGAGFDRRVGAYRAFGSVLVHREWSASDRNVDRTNANVIGSVERGFGRETYLTRVFGVLNPADASGFLRGLFVWKARDHVSIEMSAGAFLGSGDDTISRFKGRDFLFMRLNWTVMD